MIYNTTRASLLGSTRKLRCSFRVTNDSLKFLDPLFRHQSTAAEILSFINPSNGNPTATSSDYTGYINGSDGGDQCLGGFHQNSYGFHQSLNPYVYNHYQSSASYVESSEILKQRHQTRSSYGTTGYGVPQENAGFVQSHTCWNPARQSWDSCSGGQSQAWKSTNANDLLVVQDVNHFQQDHSGHGSSLDELDAICRQGKVETAVEIIKSWRNEGYSVDLPRLLWLAQLCGDAQALQEAKAVHEFITSSVSFPCISVYNTIIEMYSGCESVEYALTVFNGIPEKNSETWCAIIRCLAKNGQEEDAIDMFSRLMFKEIFFACGDINEGMLHFESMSKDYGFIPCVEHYVSLVKMLAEPGYLDEALGSVETMEPSVHLWETLGHG